MGGAMLPLEGARSNEILLQKEVGIVPEHRSGHDIVLVSVQHSMRCVQRSVGVMAFQVEYMQWLEHYYPTPSSPRLNTKLPS